MTADHLGSPRVITDQNATVTKRQDYAAFGDETTTAQRASGLKYTSADELRKGYTGYEKDDESGLDFAQARYYNSTHGRFTSVDPLTASANIKNPQTFNRYSYVLNSPYKFVDPLGLIASFCCKHADIDKQIEKDFEMVLYDDKVIKLDKKSLDALKKKLSPFYYQAARAGANAQQQINQAAEKPPKVTKIVTETLKPGTTTQTTSSVDAGVASGASSDQGIKGEVKTGTDGVNSSKSGETSAKENAEGNVALSSTVVVTDAKPTTKTTTEAVPDDSVNKANENLTKAESNIPTIAEKAADAVNGMEVTGRYFDLNTLKVGDNTAGNLKVNGFDLEPLLQNMFDAGRKSKHK